MSDAIDHSRILRRFVIAAILLSIVCLIIRQVVAEEAKTKKLPPTILQVVEQTLVVDGKASRVFNVVQPNGVEGYVGEKGHNFNVLVENKTTVPLTLHWHGLIDPNADDGVPYVTQLPIQPGGEYYYNFKLLQAGTFWLHSHYQLQEQKLMAAPLIIKDPKDPYNNDPNVVMMLQDFSFKNPAQIFQQLQKKLPQTAGSDMRLKQHDLAQMSAMQTATAMTGMLPDDMKTMSGPDLNDVHYDALLTNRHTLLQPQIIAVTPGETVRLRIINGASGTNFWIDTGKLPGTVIAADGASVKPYQNTRFQIAIAQRLDILVTIPKQSGAFPILAQGEGTRMQTGLILATTKAPIPKLSETAEHTAPALNYIQDLRLKALHPLVEKPIANVLTYTLEGNMQSYIWAINGQVWPKVTPLTIKAGQRVEMVLINKTGMAHPMHLHGHVFEIVAIDHSTISDGAMRDTILVLPHSTVKVIFNANNPGIWMLHCHVLYHQAGGMMTTVNYVGYPEPAFYQRLLKGEIKE